MAGILSQPTEDAIWFAHMGIKTQSSADKSGQESLNVYCSSQIYIDFSTYQEFINKFESEGGYVQGLMWASLPFILEQIVLSDTMIVHPDMGKNPILRDTLHWLSESNPSAKRDAERFFGSENINQSDAFFVSKYGLPYSGGSNHEEDLHDIANRMSALVSMKGSPEGRSMSSRVLRSIEQSPMTRKWTTLIF